MEPRHRDRLRAKFHQELVGKRVICLHIADDYSYMDDALIARLEATVTTYLSETPASDIRDAES